MLEKYPKDVKLVLKNYPLPMHPFSRKAAAAALAAYRQGKFWEMSQKLFEAGSSLNDEKIQDIAKELKLNMDTFNRDMNDPAIQSIISRDINEGREAEVPGTPTLFINGRLVQFRTAQDIEQAIESAISRKK